MNLTREVCKSIDFTILYQSYAFSTRLCNYGDHLKQYFCLVFLFLSVSLSMGLFFTFHIFFGVSLQSGSDLAYAKANYPRYPCS
jgi:hypothetical protein